MGKHTSIATSDFKSVIWTDNFSNDYCLHYTTGEDGRLFFTAQDVDSAVRISVKCHNGDWANKYEAYNTNHRPAKWATTKCRPEALLVPVDSLMEYLNKDDKHAERKKMLLTWLIESTQLINGQLRLYPITERSWTLLSPQVAIKTMDKSCFMDQGSGIPKDFTFFFEATAKDPEREITLIYNGKEYPALLQPDPPQHRVRIFWRNGLDKELEKYFPQELEAYKADLEVANQPELRFSRTTSPGTYRVEFIAPESVEEDIPAIPEDITPESEGARQEVTTTTRKRSAKNRRLAIEYHGLSCAVCGFNFEEAYGELGKGFIEIHHIDMLGEFEDEKAVDPSTDMIPLCSNCHRMIHRNGGLTVEALKNILKRNP